MLHTQRFIIACLALFMGVGLGFLIAGQINVTIPDTAPSVVEVVDTDASVLEFKNALALTFGLSHGKLLSEATPEMLVQAFPALILEDFSGVEMVVGRYEFVDGQLMTTNTEVVDDAADDITEAGMKTLRDTIYRRLQIDTSASLVEVMNILQTPPDSKDTTDTSPVPDPVMCTLDAKICPDGSAVGRVAPDCQFAACPDVPAEPEFVACTPQQRGAEACIEIYAPVCASVQIQCVTTPCEPIPKTYSNSCFACMEHSVAGYTPGECVTP